jgi:hypothetical protein
VSAFDGFDSEVPVIGYRVNFLDCVVKI